MIVQQVQHGSAGLGEPRLFRPRSASLLAITMLSALPRFAEPQLSLAARSWGVIDRSQ